MGVLLILMAYALLQLNRINAKSLSYSIVNGLGAGLILISLWVDFNLSAFVMESFWLIFSLFGIYKASHLKTTA